MARAARLAASAPASDPLAILTGLGDINDTADSLGASTDSSENVDLSQESLVQDMPDGGALITANLDEPLPPEPVAFDANLAETLPDDVQTELADKIIQWVEEDKQSRADWESVQSEGIRYLGLTMDDKNYPFPNSSSSFDPVLMEAVLRSYATCSAELLPASGPVKSQIMGEPTDATEDQAYRVKEWMNYYLTEGAPEWMEESNQMLMWRGIVGSMFKKTYQDPILGRPVSPYIQPQKFIVAYSTTDLDTCPRATHEIKENFSQLRKKQLSGFYRDIELGNPNDTPQSSTDILQQTTLRTEGLTTPTQTDDAPYTLYECHLDYDLEGDEHKVEGEATGLPRPYIVTVDTDSRKVLAIRRNWREGDASYQKIQYFTHYRFLPGLGFYGIGYAHILGNSAKGATGLLRQMVDAGTLEMFPGGLRVKGMKISDNNKLIGPCEFAEIETGGLPIQQAIMTMPYKGPSDISFALYKEIKENARGLGSMTEISVGDGRQDAPVGTTLALLEAANKLQSITVKNAHRALRQELRKFHSLFGQFLPDKPYPFPVPGGQLAIMKNDFTDSVDVIPVSDPNITSSAQRMMRADAIQRYAQQAPGTFNQYQVNRISLKAMGEDDNTINQVLPPPQSAQPLDPLSENENVLKGTPVAAAPYQDHEAHIAAHQPLAEQIPAMQAHIAEHIGMQMRVKVEQMLGIQLPPSGTRLPPQVENQIAMLVAQAMQLLKQQKGEDPTPGQIAMEQLRIEAQKVAAKVAETKAQTQSKAYVAQTQLITAREDRQSRERVEMLKLQTARVNNTEKMAFERTKFDKQLAKKKETQK